MLWAQEACGSVGWLSCSGSLGACLGLRVQTQHGLGPARAPGVVEGRAECREKRELERGPQRERGAFNLLCAPFPTVRCRWLYYPRLCSPATVREIVSGGETHGRPQWKGQRPLTPLLYKGASGWALHTQNFQWDFYCLILKYDWTGTSLEAQWLRLCASAPGSMGSIPGWGTKIPRAVCCSGNNFKMSVWPDSQDSAEFWGKLLTQQTSEHKGAKGTREEQKPEENVIKTGYLRKKTSHVQN